MVSKKSPKKSKSLSKRRKSLPKKELVKWGPYEKQKNKTYRPKGKCFLIEQNYQGKCTRDPLDRFQDTCYTDNYENEKSCKLSHYNNKVYKFSSIFLSNSNNRQEIFDSIANTSESKLLKLINNKMPSIEHLNKSHKMYSDLEKNHKSIYDSVIDYKGIGYSNIITFMRGTFGDSYSPFYEHISYKMNNELPIKNVGDSPAPIIVLLKYLFNLKEITKSKENSKKYNKLFIQQMKNQLKKCQNTF